MAVQEHIDIFRQGAEDWDSWREGNPKIRPDLSGLEFVNGDFSGYNLKKADLSNTEFVGCNLRNALLEGADLSAANLEASRLDGAVLMDARLINSSLEIASLQDALLIGADFFRTRLGGAYLKGATIGLTQLIDTDLSHAEGLDASRHIYPSFIGIDTLEKTAEKVQQNSYRWGEIEIFCRGAGVQDHVIEHYRSRVGARDRFFSCFISYGHKDKQFAARLHGHLQAQGIRCWLDEHDLKPGDRILDVIDKAIRLHDKILLCCSESSLESWWVKDEIRKAQDKEREEDHLIIIPLNLDGYLFEWNDGLASDLTSRLASDFTGWEHDNAKFEEQFEQVVRALRIEKGAREK